MSNVVWWALLVVCLAFAVYAANIIKNEKNVAISNGKALLFHGFEFIIPSWWTATLESENHITYERTDTRYDWVSHFRWVGDTDQDLQSIFEKMAVERQLVFDEDTSIVQAPSMLKEIYDQGIEALRIEGTATEAQEHRVYYDVFLIKGDSGVLYLESRSSILNGLLEGPFFEQAISKIKRIKKAH